MLGLVLRFPTGVLVLLIFGVWFLGWAFVRCVLLVCYFAFELLAWDSMYVEDVV